MSKFKGGEDPNSSSGRVNPAIFFFQSSSRSDTRMLLTGRSARAAMCNGHQEVV